MWALGKPTVRGKEAGERSKIGVGREADKKIRMVHYPRERKGF